MAPTVGIAVLDERFVYLAVAFNVAAFGSYLIATIRGRTRPNRVTWFIWALAPLVAFTAEVGEGVGTQALMTFMVGFGPALVFAASFLNRAAVWRLTGLDVVCGALSLVAIGVWLISGHGVWAIALTIAADGLAAVPTIVKAWSHPRTEHGATFWLAATSAVITLLTVDNWTFAHYGFPVYILAVGSLLGVLITFRLGERAVSSRAAADTA